MIINLKDIRRLGKTEEDFFFEYSPSENLCDIPGVSIVLPIEVSVTVYLTGSKTAVVEGDITFTLKGECTSCGTLAEHTQVYDFEQEFSFNNEYGYLIKSDAIDLTKLVNDEISLQMPLNFVCGEDCKGISKMEF